SRLNPNLESSFPVIINLCVSDSIPGVILISTSISLFFSANIVSNKSISSKLSIIIQPILASIANSNSLLFYYSHENVFFQVENQLLKQYITHLLKRYLNLSFPV